MKNSKKYLCVLFVTVLLFAVTINCSAAVISDNVTVVFEDENILSEERKEYLTNIIMQYYINGFVNDKTTSTYGIMCTLFGHDEIYDSVSTIEHKVRTAQPRCYRTDYDVITCSRCDYESITPVGSYYYPCCPND